MPIPRVSRAGSLARGPWWARYLLAAGIVAVASLLRTLADPLIHDQIPYFIYVAAVVVATWSCGTDGGVLSMVLAAFAGNYLFVDPRYQLIPHEEDWIAMGMFAVVAGGLVVLVGRWKAAEEVLRRQSEELQEQGRELRAQAVSLRAQAEKLEVLHREAERVNTVKDEFLATLSHELRTPLNAIVGWAHLLVGQGLHPDAQRSAAETILRNANTQARLIEDLLDVSRIVSGKLYLHLAPVDLGATTEAGIDLLRPAADAKAIDVRLKLGPDLVLLGDADRLRQIVWNLVSNAIKFTPRQGHVSIRVERTDSQIELEVSDSGIGVEAEFVPHLFERFSQADSSTTRGHGGLGLGLAVVRHLAELHGGTVSAASAGRGSGATFTVSLPVRAVAEAPAPVVAEPRTGEGRHAAAERLRVLDGIKVLVVDDDADARRLVQAVLAGYGAQVKAVASAHLAFEAVRTWRPDVLVADIAMPVEDGYSLLRRIRKLPSADGGAIPAAALTAYAQSHDRERALAAGFQEHVSKPVPPEQLARAVARLARRSHPERIN